MKNIKYVLRSVVLALVGFFMVPMSVSADIGPKPSVVIDFVGLEDEVYYVTLLSEDTSTGPWSLGNEYYEYMGDKSVFDKFCEYEDEDGYYFLSFMEDCSEDDTFEWNYYPPSSFKILIYFPEHDSFYTDEIIYERYAFDSYFTVEVSDEETLTESDGDDDTKVAVTETKRSYDFSMEIVSLLARVVLTIAIEIIIALIFIYRDKKSLAIITVTNVFTQVILNILLNIANYQSGQYAFVFHYVWMECVVFLVEAIIFAKAIGKVNLNTNKKYHPYWYAGVANIVSFVVGMWIARVIPGIF